MLKISEISSKFPICHGRVTLRLFKENDIQDNYISWLNDPDVVKYSNQRFISHTKETSLSFLNSIKNSQAIFLAITDRDTKEVFGTMTVYFSLDHNTADIGIMLGDKSYWNKGLGAEAWQLLMDFLLKKLSIRKVTGGTLSCNTGMMRIFEKVGMIPDGIRIDQELLDGKPYDIVYFAKFKK